LHGCQSELEYHALSLTTGRRMLPVPEPLNTTRDNFSNLFLASSAKSLVA
jgi:hypothetical protein